MHGLLGSDSIRPEMQLFFNQKKNKKWNIEKIALKVVQIRFLPIHITNQKLRFDIVTVGNLQNILMEDDLYLIS